MSEPPCEMLRPQELMGDLVKLLAITNHDTRQFLGLVKRTQIAALLVRGVFSKKRDIRGKKDLVAAQYGIQMSGNDEIRESGPLMHFAYCINDDR